MPWYRILSAIDRKASIYPALRFNAHSDDARKVFRLFSEARAGLSCDTFYRLCEQRDDGKPEEIIEEREVTEALGSAHASDFPPVPPSDADHWTCRTMRLEAWESLLRCARDTFPEAPLSRLDVFAGFLECVWGDALKHLDEAHEIDQTKAIEARVFAGEMIFSDDIEEHIDTSMWCRRDEIDDELDDDDVTDIAADRGLLPLYDGAPLTARADGTLLSRDGMTRFRLVQIDD